ncbi:MAG: zinc-finger domain-containing protein [Pseudomonadota bacterium]
MGSLDREITFVEKRRVSCDGAGEIRNGEGYRPAALGHPRVFMEIDESGYVDCGYCDRRFVLRGGPADEIAGGTAGEAPGEAPGA